MKSKVLVAVNTYPGHAYCRDELVPILKEMAKNPRCEVVIFYNGERNPVGFEDFKIIYYDPPTGARGIDVLLEKQRMIRKYFLKRIEYGYLFMLESDNIPQPDIVEKFLSYNKDIVSAVYFIKALDREVIKLPYDIQFSVYDHKHGTNEKRQFKAGDPIMILLQKHIPSVWGVKKGKSTFWEFNDVFPQRGLVKILSAGFGCAMIKRDVIRDIDFELRDPSDPKQQFTDFLFYHAAMMKGYTAYVDTDTIVEHHHIDWDSQNYRKWFKSDTLESVPTPEWGKLIDKRVF